MAVRAPCVRLSRSILSIPHLQSVRFLLLLCYFECTTQRGSQDGHQSPKLTFVETPLKTRILLSLQIISLLSSFSLAQQFPRNQSGVAGGQSPREAIQIPFVNKTLRNGLEIIVLPDSAVPIVTVEVAVKNGSYTEPPELNGLSHLYEHMFFKSNAATALYRCDLFGKYNRADLFRDFNCGETLKLRNTLGDVSYLDEADRIGLLRNGTTQEEYVNYFFTSTSGNLPLLMKMMRDSLLFPSFDEDEFGREKEVVIGELDRNLSEPGYYLDRTMMDRLFFRYPSRKSPGGNRETVGSATTSKMRLIQSRYYIPNNSALIVTGDVDPQRVFSIAEEFFSAWKSGADPFKELPLVDHPPLPKSEGHIVKQDVENVILQLGWHGPSVGKDDESTYAADVFSNIVEQPNSKFQRTLIDAGLAASITVHYYTQRNVGPIRITMVTTAEKAKAALAALYAEINRFGDADYFTDEELESAKNLLESEDLYSREKLSEYTHSLGFWWSSTGVDYFRSYHRNLRAVNRKSIERYLKTYLIGKNHITVALISDADLKASGITSGDLVGR